jgi:glyoxylase-like metal-dependent hydrolase (beta-lactamase superfamily II)
MNSDEMSAFSSRGTLPSSRHMEIEALVRAVRWPNADRAAVMTLTGLLVAARRYDEASEYFLDRAEAEPQQPLYEALAGFFQALAGHDIGAAVATLDRAAQRDLGLPNFFRGLALSGLPGFAGRADTVVSDLELVVAVKDQFPPGLLREALELSGYTQKAEDVPVLTADWSLTARDGARFAPPRFVEVMPGIHLAQGFDFSDFAFVDTGAGIVVIDTGSNDRHMREALAELRKKTAAPITHVILTHAHWDHVGGLSAVNGAGVQVIAQVNFAEELRLQSSVPVISPYFLAQGESQEQHVAPDRLVGEKETLRAGNTELILYPTRGGETSDGLIIHLPQREVVFTGDMIMPYIGAPFLPEGSVQGLLEAMDLVQGLSPRLLIQGHPPITELFTIETFPALGAALRDLNEAVVVAIRSGSTLTEILHLNHLPDLLRDHPPAVVPYMSIRDNLIKRIYHQRTGYWKSGGEGIENIAPADWAAALNLLGGSQGAFAAAAGQILQSGNEALALKIADYGLMNYPASGPLMALRREILYRLVERHQQLNPFKFVYYAGLAGLELAPAR